MSLELASCRFAFEQTLARSLQELLDYVGDDIEEVMAQSFQVSYQDVFGNVVSHNLIPSGDTVMVNKQNRQVSRPCLRHSSMYI